MGVGDQSLGRAVLELSTDGASFFSDLDKAEKRAVDLRASFNLVGKDLDKLAAGMTAAGQKSAESLQMIGGMSAAGRTAAEGLKPVVDVTDSWTASIGKMAAGYALGIATLGTVKRVVGELTAFVFDSIAAAGEAQAVQAKLSAALKNTHQDVEATSRQFKVYAENLQVTTTLEDDAVLSVMALATEMGVSADQMLRVSRVSADLSAAWGISLEQAMSTVVKGGEGMTRTFKAHAIELDENRAKAEGLAYVLPELEKHFNGNAAAQLATYTGHVTALGVAWGNLKEALGGLFTSSQQAMGALANTTTLVRGLSTVIEKEGVGGLMKFMALGGDWVPMLFGVGKAAEEAAKQLKITGDISLDTADDTDQLARKIKELRDSALVPLTATQREHIDELAQLGVSESEIAALVRASTGAVHAYIAARREEKAELKDLMAAYDKFHVLTLNNNRMILKQQEELLGARLKQVNEGIIAEFNAQVKLNAAQGLDAAGAIQVQMTAAERLRIGLLELEKVAVEGVSQKAQAKVLTDAYAQSLYDEAVAIDAEFAALRRTNEELKKVPELKRAAEASFLTGPGIPSVGQTVLPGGRFGPSDYGGNIGIPMSSVGVPMADNIGRPSTAGYPISVPVTINGSVLSDEQKIARAIQSSVEAALRNAGVRLGF